MNRVINKEILIPLRPKFVLRRLGYGAYRPAPKPLTNRLMGLLAETRALIEPKIAYVDAEVVRRAEDYVDIEGNLYLPGKKIAALLSKCTQVTIFAATVGETIESVIEERWQNNRDDEALIIDAIASEAAEELARTTHKWTHFRAKRSRLAVTARYSPGFGDFPLAIQPQIIKYVNAASIGIAINDSFMMIPRKSVSGVIGLYPKSEGLNA